MASERYSETRSFSERSRQGTNDGLQFPNDQRVNLPIQQSIHRFNQSTNDERLQERLRHQDTSLQWVNDTITGAEKFRININIDGFDRNEVNIRVDGNKLFVFGEHLESKNQSTAKKVIEKSYELPRDVNPSSPQVTFPSPTTMQVDFPSRHSNVIIDDGRISSNLITNLDSTHRTPPRLAQERSSTEYTSTRRIGGSGNDSSFIQKPTPRFQPTYYDDLDTGNNLGRNSTYSSTTNYQSGGNPIPVRRDYTSTSSTFNNSNNPPYAFNVTSSNTLPRTIYPSSRGESGNVHEQTFTETHKETTHRRSSPTSGVQSSREVEHQRSGSPSIGQTLDEDRFRTNLNISDHSLTAPRSARNTEVREFSRRIGNTGNNSSFIPTEPSIFSHGFNSDAFYRSAFQPQVFTDNSGQKRIEMKLDVSKYEPNEIKVAVEGDDLVVKAEHNVERPPTSSTRAYFFKQITLPPNTDLKSLKSEHHPDGRLRITANLIQ